MRWLRRSAPLLLVTLPVHAQVGAPPASSGQVLQIAGRTNATPSIAAAGTYVAVAWTAATVTAMDVYVALSRDAGRTFAPPVLVNATPGDARANGEQPPRVALIPKARGVPEVIVVWTSRRGGNTVLLAARSTDGARQFGDATPVPWSDAPGARGWHSVAVDQTGRVFVAWLDHRGLAGHPMAHGADAPTTDPTERASHSQLRIASLDRHTSSVLASSVCYCCKTSLVTGGTHVRVVWRHVFPGSQRDIAIATSRDAGRTFDPPQRVSDDRWTLDGCPDNGPAIALDHRQRAVVVWPAPEGGSASSALTLWAATDRAAGGFTPRVQLPTHGPAGHPQLAMGVDDRAFVIWDEVVQGQRRVAMARIQRDGTERLRVEALPFPSASMEQWYPVVALAEQGTTPVGAWVQQAPGGSVIMVQRLPWTVRTR